MRVTGMPGAIVKVPPGRVMMQTLQPIACGRQSPLDPGSAGTRMRRVPARRVSDVTGSNALGEYLRARRELTDPADAGLRVTGVRRTPGLRREEVATLAGISADYYLRLEQGRDRNPSPQVLESIARVFRLDRAATEYLLGLTSARPRRPRRQVVPVGIRQLLDVLELPAFVESRTFDVLAANRLATALSPAMRPGENRLRSVFLDPAEQDLHPDWERAAASIVASFRASAGAPGADGDPAAARLIGELSLASEAFRQLWARHDVKALAGAPARILHPQAGPLELRREKLAVGESGGQMLVIYHAELGSDTARSLALLGS